MGETLTQILDLVLSRDETYKYYQDKEDSSLPHSTSSNQKTNNKAK